MAEQKFVVWRLHKGTWVRATQPVPWYDALRMRDAANAPGRGDVHIVQGEHDSPPEPPR